MSISILNAGAAGAAQEQFGFWNALHEGGAISYATAGILLIMSTVSICCGVALRIAS